MDVVREYGVAFRDRLHGVERLQVEFYAKIIVPLFPVRRDINYPAFGIHAPGVLDWDHRYKQMRLHGTVHLHHCMMEKLLGHALPNPATSDLQDDATAYNRYEIREVTGDLVNRANAELETTTTASQRSEISRSGACSIR